MTAPEPMRALGGSAALPRADGGDEERAGRASRLAAHVVPGSDASTALARLTDLAARLLHVGTAQVSLVSEVQQVVSAGGPAGAVADGVPAQAGVCWWVVRSGEPVVITDATADPRIADLPAVVSGEVGSYAGVPLVDADGSVVGALCAIDPAPREWSEHDLDLLRELSGPALAEIQLAAVVAAYEDDRLVWQLAVDSAGVGAFDWDVASGALRWDDRLLQLFGLDRQSFGGSITSFFDAVHPDDRDRVGRELQEAVDGAGTFESEYRVVLRGGEVRWIAARGHVVPGPDGSASRLLGAAYDTTAVQDGEARVARVLESMPTAYYQLDDGWRFTYVNAEAERLLGQDRSTLLGGSVWDLFPATVGSVFEDSYHAAVRSGRPVEFEAYYPAPLDGWYEVRAWPSPGGLAVYFLEITDRVRDRTDLAAAADRARLAGHVSDVLTEILDTDEALRRIGPLLVPALGDWCVVTTAPSLDASWHDMEDRHVTHADPDRLALAEAYVDARGRSLTRDPFLTEIFDDELTVVLTTTFDLRDRQALATPDGHDLRTALFRLAPASAAFVPLRARGRTAGVLSVYRDRTDQAFTPAELDLLADIGRRTGLALDNARLYGEQRDLAIGLQQSLLTEPPTIDDLEIVVRYLPAADAAQVGGDWYDAFLQHHPRDPSGGPAPADRAQRPDEGLATVFVIGDVMGHDTRAAAVMGQVRSLLRGAALENSAGPASLLESVDRAMVSLGFDTIASAVVARLEQTPSERRDGTTRLRWSNAGHPAPLLLSPAGDVTFLDDPVNVVLGTTSTVERREAVLELERGSTLLLYTDGLVERRGETLDDGSEALRRAALRLLADRPDLESLCDGLLRELVSEHAEDDVALIAVTLHPQDAGGVSAT